MKKSIDQEIDIICNYCEHKMNHNDIELYPTRTDFFTEWNLQKMESESTSKKFISSIRKKDREMKVLQKKLHADFDGTVDKIINTISTSDEEEDDMKYKIHFLNVMKRLRSKLDEGLKKHVDNYTVYPGLVFGYYDFSYKGHCLNCDKLIGTVWRGHESLRQGVRLKQKDKDDRTVFECKRCESAIVAEHQLWYAYGVDRSGNFGAYMQTICKTCHRVQDYPYEFQTEGAIHVQGGGPYSKLEEDDLEDWMYPRVILYMNQGGKFTDTQIFNVTKKFGREHADLRSVLDNDLDIQVYPN